MRRTWTSLKTLLFKNLLGLRVETESQEDAIPILPVPSLPSPLFGFVSHEVKSRHPYFASYLLFLISCHPYLASYPLWLFPVIFVLLLISFVISCHPYNIASYLLRLSPVILILLLISCGSFPSSLYCFISHVVFFCHPCFASYLPLLFSVILILLLICFVISCHPYIIASYLLRLSPVILILPLISFVISRHPYIASYPLSLFSVIHVLFCILYI